MSKELSILLVKLYPFVVGKPLKVLQYALNDILKHPFLSVVDHSTLRRLESPKLVNLVSHHVVQLGLEVLYVRVVSLFTFQLNEVKETEISLI